MRVQIITKDNGLGLSHDIRVLKEAIHLARPDAEVTVADWLKPVQGFSCDINVFLELLNPKFIPQAKRNIYVPNPEWYISSMWGSVLPKMTEVWGKTHDGVRCFTGLHKNVIYSGWTSEDIRMPEVERIPSMIHVAGGSSAKGTAEVIAAMRTLPNRRLLLVSRKALGNTPPNVDMMIDPSDMILRGAQNACLVHLCPSSYEGFGHYINEARACGAFIITTNAPPMNEMVTRDIGAGVSFASTGRQHLAKHHHVDAGELARVLEEVMATNDRLLTSVGERARRAYETDRMAFHAFIKEQLAP